MEISQDLSDDEAYVDDSSDFTTGTPFELRSPDRPLPLRSISLTAELNDLPPVKRPAHDQTFIIDRGEEFARRIKLESESSQNTTFVTLPLDEMHRLTLAQDARRTVQRLGVNYLNKNKGTLLHSCVHRTASHVYVFASAGVPVNVQNQSGDTALHVAVQWNRADIAEAILQCGADLTIRNKLGQTATEAANGPLKQILHRYEPGLVQAVKQGNTRRVNQLVKRFWSSVATIVKDGRNIMDYAATLDEPKHSSCIRLLKDLRKTSELTHAVLCENMAQVKRILTHDKRWNVNSRLRDQNGPSLLSCAIERNNLDLAEMLVQAGANVDNLRIRINNTTEETEPLFHKCLIADSSLELAMLIHSHQRTEEHSEKDSSGNTPLLRAVKEGVSSHWIMWLLSEQQGYNITDRNQDGINARELALSLGRNDVVQAIDKFVIHNADSQFFLHLPVNFYGKDNLQIQDETGRSITNVLERRGIKDGVLMLQYYDDIELHPYFAHVGINRSLHLVNLNLNKNYTLQFHGVDLLMAASRGAIVSVEHLHNACYRDKNGFTALIRAIVYNQLEVAEFLCMQRPELKTIPDNCNRYPLHYAYLLPAAEAASIIRLMLKGDSHIIETRRDKDGRMAAEYKMLQDTEEMRQVLHDARTLDPHGQRSLQLESLLTEEMTE